LKIIVKVFYLIQQSASLSLRKIIQLALNIGQFTGTGGIKQPWMYLKYYLTARNIDKINRQLPKK